MRFNDQARSAKAGGSLSEASRHSLTSLALAAAFAWMGASAASAQATNQAMADTWVTNIVRYPVAVQTNLVRPADFENLHVEVIAGKVKAVWPKGDLSESSSVTLTASADVPGHWPARDWRTYPMTKRGVNWEATPPVDNVDIPLLFFLSASNGSFAAVSPMRICRPRGVGLEEPSQVFWPFLEGFEEQLESWRLVDAENAAAPLKKGIPARHGKAALVVALAANKHSVTLATTRARGWQIEEKGATGLRLWLRTKSGEGAARFTILANAYAPGQVVSQFPEDFPLNSQWQKLDLPFTRFPKLPLGEIDLFTIEFTGNGPLEFLVDDFQLLGGWKLLVE